MEIKDCYNLGRITKAWGYKGQVVIFLDVDTPEDYAGLDSAFVEVKGKLIPYFFRIDSLNGNAALSGVTAVKNRNYVVVTLPEVFASSRVADTIEKFAKAFHPDCFGSQAG